MGKTNLLWVTGSKGLLGSALCACIHNVIQKLASDKASAPDLQQAKPARKQPMFKNMGDGRGCKGGDAGEVNRQLLNHVVYMQEGDFFIQTGKDVDISDLNAVKIFCQKNVGITHVINCAAYSAVDAAEEFRKEAFRTNAIGPENLAIVAKEIGAKLIHISTDYVFPGEGRKLLTEKDPTRPCNYYGQTKLEGEMRALQHGACVIRTSWIFGNGGKNFVSKLLKMLQSQKEIRLTDDQWGRFTYAPDLASAILQMLDQEGLYQYANAGVTTRYEFGLTMREEALLLGFPILADAIIPVSNLAFPTPCKRPTFSALDTSEIEKIVKIRHWRDALRKFLCEQMPVYS